MEKIKEMKNKLDSLKCWIKALHDSAITLETIVDPETKRVGERVLEINRWDAEQEIQLFQAELRLLELEIFSK